MSDLEFLPEGRPRFGPGAVRDAFVRLYLRVGYRVITVGWWLFRPHTEGAQVAIWVDQRVLVIRNSYRRGLALPGGAPKRGEALIDTAVRELREETGVRVASEHLSEALEVEQTTEYKRDRVQIFEAELFECPELRVDRREVTVAGFTDPRKLDREMLHYPLRKYLEWRAGLDGRP